MANANRFNSLAEGNEHHNKAQNVYVPSGKDRDEDKQRGDRRRGVFENGRYRKARGDKANEPQSGINHARNGPGASYGARGFKRASQGYCSNRRVVPTQRSHRDSGAESQEIRSSMSGSQGTGRGNDDASSREKLLPPGSVNVFGQNTNAPRSSFPRVVPLNIPVNKQKAQQRIHDLSVENSVSYLREVPDDGDYFSLKGVFLWPSEETGIEPMRAENAALDETRKRYNCHIVLAHNPRRLCIYGPNYEDNNAEASSASSALQEVRNLLQEIMERDSQCLRFILAQPPLGHNLQPMVRMLTPLSNNTVSKFAANIPNGEGKVALAEASTNKPDDDWAVYAHRKVLKNTLMLEMALARGLGRLVTSPGRVEVKAIIGCFVFRRMAINGEGTYSTTPFKSFMSNLKSTKCDGGLFRLLPQARLFERIMDSQDILVAFSKGKPCALADVKPTFSGIFTFPPQSGDIVDRQLYVETGAVQIENDMPSIRRRDWTSPVERATSRRMEAFVTALDGGLSWKFEAVAHPFCRNIGDVLQRFEARVTLLPATIASNHLGSTELMFEFPPGDSYKLKDFYQRTQWRFFARSNPKYVVQVSRLDRFTRSHPGSGGQSRNDVESRRPTQTQWDISVFHEEWDDILGENATLGIGQSATWQPSIAKFFPSSTTGAGDRVSGFADFVNCVTALCQGISVMRSGEIRN